MRTRRALGAALLALVVGAGCSEKTNDSQFGIVYTQGPIEGERFDKVIPPGGSQTVIDDVVYKLPARQISYHVGNDDQDPSKPCGECDRRAIRFTAKGGVDMFLELTNLSFLNYREAAIKPFFNEVCSKFDNCQDDGWTNALNYAFGKPLEDAVKDIGLRYDPELLRYDSATKEDFAAELAADFVDYQGNYLGRGDVFCGPGYDYKQENEEHEDFCPVIESSVTEIKFANADRESVHEREQLSAAEEQLAVQELETARAQQETNRVEATPENLALIQARAMEKCAANPSGCTLTVILGADGITPTVPAG